MRICWIGFGEAGRTFATGMTSPGRAYDLRDDSEMRQAMAAAGVTPTTSYLEAISATDSVLSLVTADQACATAQEVARNDLGGAFYFDMNSVAPDTKRAAAQLIDAAGGRYVDVAVMAPVQPKGRSVPLLVSGPHAQQGADALNEIDFTAIEIAGEKVGDASAIKMIRSVMVKGIEALSAECALAAAAAGVLDGVVASLDVSSPSEGWAGRFNYNLDRMLVHGVRRAAEMEEVVKTLNALGTGSIMSQATAQRQRALGSLQISPAGRLTDKLGQIRETA
ncbi:MAG: DUF1932 domain-containing protein [Sphingomicrobium sp.]